MNNSIERIISQRPHLERLIQGLIDLANDLGFARSAEQAQDWFDLLGRKSLTVAFVGRFAAGKSAIINVLVGDYILPEGPVPTTALITRVVDESDAPRVTISSDGLQSESTIRRSGDVSQTLSDLYASKHHRLDTLVSVYTDLPDLYKDMVLIDTPGLEVNAERTNAVTNFLLGADAVVFVLSATMPLSLSERDFIHERVWEAGIRNVFFLLNKIDLLSTVQSHVRVKELVYHQLRDMLRSNPRFYTVTTHLPEDTVGSVNLSSPEVNQLDQFREDLHSFLHTDERTAAHFGHVLGKARLELSSILRRTESTQFGRAILDEMRQSRRYRPVLQHLQDWVEDDLEISENPGLILEGQHVIQTFHEAWRSLATEPVNLINDEPVRHKPEEYSEIMEDSIFVSYKREDWDAFVKLAVARLQAAGLSIWVDQYLLNSGSDWQDEINKALQRCNRMILCVSEEALQSWHVKVEYRYFLNNNKSVFPVICRPVKELPPELQIINYTTFEKLDSLIQQLVR